MRRSDEWYREKLFSCGVPQHMHDAYVMYLLHGIEPGDFLLAVLANDLRGAIGRADHMNARALKEHVLFLYNDAPGDCWGSWDRVRSWVRRFQDARESATSVDAVDPQATSAGKPSTRDNSSSSVTGSNQQGER